jgi:hypothetical protein
MLISLLRSLLNARVPGQLIIQVTDKCNARCPQCGMRVTEKFPRATLPVEAIKAMLDAAPRHRVQAVSFTGGEPLLYLDEILDLVQHAGRVGIAFVRTGTNGFLFRHWERADFSERMHRLAERLAATPVRNFWISIDSVDSALHEEMRGFPGVIRGIEKALPIFHAHGLYPSANLGINRNMGGSLTRELQPGDFRDRATYLKAFGKVYKDVFQRFYQHIIDLGFTMVNTCYPMSIGAHEAQQGLSPVYAATAIGNVVRFAADEKVALFGALLKTIPKYRSKVRIFSPLCSLYALVRQHGLSSSSERVHEKKRPGYGCRGGLDFWFVDARDGHAYPCGYRGGEDFGPFEEMVSVPYEEGSGCNRCDWECFRDPSELFGPLLEGLGSPMRLLTRLKMDPQFFKHWRQDLAYYRACDFFDGRKALQHRRLATFACPQERSFSAGASSRLAPS